MKLSTIYMFSLAALALSAMPALAVDGITLISQSTVMAAGGFPYVISQPGSYRLSGSLVTNNSTGISITASNVTLDLNGFSLTCTAPCNSSAYGIDALGSSVTVVNGTISSFSNGVGVSFRSTLSVADRVVVTNNENGIAANGDVAVSNSTLSGNAVYGIFVNQGAVLLLTNCKFIGNGYFGALVNLDSGGASISNSIFASNGSPGFGGGIKLSGGGVVTTSMFYNNGIAAIRGGGTSAGPILYGMNSFRANPPTEGGGAFVSAGNNACVPGATSTLC